MKKENFNKGEVIIYKTANNEVGLKVTLEKDTVWLTQNQIALLFNTKRPAITKHLNNIFKTEELKKNSVSSILEHTASDGKIYKTLFYSLDVIISVGYRVNSRRATEFRIWASKVLKQHLIGGYTINKTRLLETQNKFKKLQEAVLFLQKQSKTELLTGQESEILNLLAEYSKTLSVLNQFDKGKLTLGKEQKTKFNLKYTDCTKIINEIKKSLVVKKEASDLFGQERDGVFSGIIEGLYQTFNDNYLYPTIEDKATHLLYFIIKDHPFTDGNKRIASFLFIYFLNKNDYMFKKSGERKINDNALVALALLIAESNPNDKEIIINIIKNLIGD